jgi:hypothetical protein
MDRRDALKKLGVGGAVAVAGPVLLQSYAVAAGASSMPSASQVGAATSHTSTNSNKTLNITIAPSPFPSGTTYFWTEVGGSTTVSFSSPTSLNTSVTVSTGNLGSKAFTLNLAATHPLGDTVNYRFSWSGSSLSVS